MRTNKWRHKTSPVLSVYKAWNDSTVIESPCCLPSSWLPFTCSSERLWLSPFSLAAQWPFLSRWRAIAFYHTCWLLIDELDNSLYLFQLTRQSARYSVLLVLVNIKLLNESIVMQHKPVTSQERTRPLFIPSCLFYAQYVNFIKLIVKLRSVPI